jgi:hypothetical protein
MGPTASAPIAMPPETLGGTPDCSSRSHYWRNIRSCSSNSHGTRDIGKNTSLCSFGVVAGRDVWRNTRSRSPNSYAIRDPGRHTRLCSSRFIISEISRWNARGGGSSAPGIGHDFAVSVNQVVEDKDRRIGTRWPNSGSCINRAPCGVILSLKYTLIGCDLINRSCSPKTDNLGLEILDQITRRNLNT